ncbi:unnamed protein product [Musa acuminata var. zebrina]
MAPKSGVAGSKEEKILREGIIFSRTRTQLVIKVKNTCLSY